MDKDMLAKLIREACAAHKEYEATLDESDERWADWYAAYIIERLDEELSVVDKDAEVLPEEEEFDE